MRFAFKCCSALKSRLWKAHCVAPCLLHWSSPYQITLLKRRCFLPSICQLRVESEKKDGLFFHVNSKRISDTWMISSHYVFHCAWASPIVSPSNTAAGAFTTVFAFYRSQLCLPARCRLGKTISPGMAAVLWAAFQGKAACRSVGQLRSCDMASFWHLFLKVCPASDSWGWVKNTIRHQRVRICSCLHESKSLANRWEWSQIRWDMGYWTHLSETSVRKDEYSSTAVRCDAHSLSVAAD